EISNDKLQLAEEVDKEKSRAGRLEQEVNKLQEQLESMKVDEEKEESTTTNGTTREVVYEENQNHQPLTSTSSTNEEIKQLLFKERQKTLNLELQLKLVLEASSNLNLSPPNSASRRYSFSQFSGDFEIGKCSGC